MNAESRDFIRALVVEIAKNVEKINDPEQLKGYLQEVFDAEVGLYLYDVYCRGGIKVLVSALVRVILYPIKLEEPKRTITMRHMMQSLQRYPPHSKIRTVVPNFPFSALDCQEMDVDRKALLRKTDFASFGRLSDDVHTAFHNLCMMVVDRYGDQSTTANIQRTLEWNPNANITQSSDHRAVLKQLQQACLHRLVQTMSRYLQDGRVVLSYGLFIKGLQELQWPQQL